MCYNGAFRKSAFTRRNAFRCGRHKGCRISVAILHGRTRQSVKVKALLLRWPSRYWKFRRKACRINTDLEEDNQKNKCCCTTGGSNHSPNGRRNWKPFGPSVENSSRHRPIAQHFGRNRSASCHQKMSRNDKLSVRWHLHHAIIAYIGMWIALFSKAVLTVVQMPFSRSREVKERAAKAWSEKSRASIVM